MNHLSRLWAARPGRLVSWTALVLLGLAAAGCGNVGRRIAEIQSRHGVALDVTDDGRGQDWLGGNTFAVVDNIGRELAAFPYLATAGRRIHVAATSDLLRRTYPEEIADALLAGAATQDHPGPDLGDIYVLNKNLWGLYVDLFQPGTQMLYDPHLRHEIMHAIEIDSLRDMVLEEPWQAVLDKSGEMVYRLGQIDALALAMPGALRCAARAAETAAPASDPAGPPAALVTARHEAYADFCARWLAAHFGDVTGDGRIDDADALALGSRAAEFDADKDGRLTYADATARTGLRHSMLSGANPLSQIEMTAGMLGYRPSGFASAYGRTAPWEDKAEVLDYAVRHKMIPHLFAAPRSMDGVTGPSAAEAAARLESVRRADPVLARKIEALTVFLGNLAAPEHRSAAFAARYAPAMVPMDRLLGRDEDASRLAAARRAASARRVASTERRVEVRGTTATVTIGPAASIAAE